MTPRMMPFGRALLLAGLIERYGEEFDGRTGVGWSGDLGAGGGSSAARFDAWFRSTSGNTQVSAAEIRAMPLPPLEAIHAIGREAMHSKSLAELDEMVERLTGSRERIAGSSRRVKPHPATTVHHTLSLQLPDMAHVSGREVEPSLHC